jgi:hypothetical protein
MSSAAQPIQLNFPVHGLVGTYVPAINFGSSLRDQLPHMPPARPIQPCLRHAHNITARIFWHWVVVCEYAERPKPHIRFVALILHLTKYQRDSPFAHSNDLLIRWTHRHCRNRRGYASLFMPIQEKLCKLRTIIYNISIAEPATITYYTDWAYGEKFCLMSVRRNPTNNSHD